MNSLSPGTIRVSQSTILSVKPTFLAPVSGASPLSLTADYMIMQNILNLMSIEFLNRNDLLFSYLADEDKTSVQFVSRDQEANKQLE